MREIIRFSSEEFRKCETFAEQIKWKHPHFKDNRNTERRSPEHIKQDVILGKLAEVAVQKYMCQNFSNYVSDLDFNIYGAGIADDYDLKVGNQLIYIKSSKMGSSCLLIEKAKFQVNEDGIPITLEHKPFPDILIFVRVNYWDKSFNSNLYAEINGGISWQEFWDTKKFLPRGFILNKQSALDFLVKNKRREDISIEGKGIKLLADNYGVHIDKLHDIKSLIQID